MGGSSELQQQHPLPLLIFVLSHLLVLLLLTSFSSIKAEPAGPPSCPSTISFGKCGGHKFRSLYYPFTNSSFIECGYFVLECIHNQTTLSVRGTGPKTPIKGFADVNQTVVLAPYEKPHPNAKPNDFCYPMENFSLFESPSISFTILHDQTCVGCPHDLSMMGPNIDGKWHDCGYIYGPYSNDYIPDPLLRLPGCSIFPASPSPTGGLTFQYNLTSSCQDCVHNRGGRCYDDPTPGSWNSMCTKNKKTGTSKLIETVSLVAGLSLAGIIVLISLIIFSIKKRREGGTLATRRNCGDVETFLKNNKALSPKRITYSGIKKITNNFKEKLGQGGYGTVYKGSLLNGHLVAVKLLNRSSSKDGQEFINEVAGISQTNHVNVVTLLGFCCEGSRRALVYEFMTNGSLEKFTHSSGDANTQRLPWETLFRISLGIARGLEYLHRGCNIRIVHFDIKPHNILLDEEFNPKISDFGLCKLCPDSRRSELSILEARGTIGYIAPEVFSRNIGNVSHKSDVYSYGMMLLDVLGSRRTGDVDGGKGGSSDFYFPDWIYKQLQDDRELDVDDVLTMNEEEKRLKRKMTLVSLWCIQTVPSQRPSISRVVQLLEGSIDLIEIPPPPAFSSPPRPTPGPGSSTFSAQDL